MMQVCRTVPASTCLLIRVKKNIEIKFVWYHSARNSEYSVRLLALENLLVGFGNSINVREWTYLVFLSFTPMTQFIWPMVYKTVYLQDYRIWLCPAGFLTAQFMQKLRIYEAFVLIDHLNSSNKGVIIYSYCRIRAARNLSTI